MQDASEIATSLCRTPLLSIAELQTQLNADRVAHGIYALWLTNPETLAAVVSTPHPSEPVGLLYVGIGPGAASSKRTLRARFRDHARDTGRSTLRRALASFLYEQEGWRPYFTDRPLLEEPDNDALSAWIERNLRVQWVRVAEPWAVEADLIRLMRPPLNRTHNDAHPFYTVVGDARRRFREAAEAARR
jgi:GIY-YIG catalytic domain